MAKNTYETLVIGGGISGLTAAYRLHEADHDVGLIEAGEAVGGATRTVARDGFLLEQGPFNVIVRDPAFANLLEDLQGEIEVVTANPAAKTRFLYKNSEIHPVPSNPGALFGSKLLSASAKRRMVRGLLWSKPGQREDESIEDVAVRRLGREATDTLVSAMIAGIYAGDISKLCLNDCFPTVGAMDREARSLPLYMMTGGVSKHSKAPKGKKRRWKGLVSLAGGLGSLSDALARPLGDNLMTQARVDRIEATADGYRVHVRRFAGAPDGGRAEAIDAHRLVLATPVHVTASLIRGLCAAAADTLESVEAAPMVVLNLGFKRRDIAHDLNGFGFLVPKTETDFPLLGVLWADSIFPQHAPADHRLLRVFIGGSRTPDAATRSDENLMQAASDGIREVLGVSEPPALVNICRWPKAIPQYTAGHRTRMAGAIGQLGASAPNLLCCGNYIEGVSLNDCIRSGANIAQTIISGQPMRTSAAATQADQRQLVMA